MPFFHLCLTCHCTLLVTLVPPILLLLVHYASLTPFFSSAFIVKRFALGVLNLAFDDVERDELIRLPTSSSAILKIIPGIPSCFSRSYQCSFPKSQLYGNRGTNLSSWCELFNNLKSVKISSWYWFPVPNNKEQESPFHPHISQKGVFTYTLWLFHIYTVDKNICLSSQVIIPYPSNHN